jgi:hypothetical protein
MSLDKLRVERETKFPNVPNQNHEIASKNFYAIASKNIPALQHWAEK